jgi:hypothetical protein
MLEMKQTVEWYDPMEYVVGKDVVLSLDRIGIVAYSIPLEGSVVLKDYYHAVVS